MEWRGGCCCCSIEEEVGLMFEHDLQSKRV